MNPIANAENLKTKAEIILHETGLENLLSEYGTVHFTGSYKYDLMTWPDIDICLELENIERNIIFEIGEHISTIPKVGTMYFRDEFVLNTAGNPKAMFWCIELFQEDDIKWKIDILISNSKEVNRILQLGENIFRNLNNENRKIILEIKSLLSSHPDYRIKFRSTDIYNAVLEQGVRCMDDWNQLRKRA